VAEQTGLTWKLARRHPVSLVVIGLLKGEEVSLSPIERRVLCAMAKVSAESCARKSVVVLRYALLEANAWDEDVESSLCNGGNEHPIVAEHYAAIRRLVLETDLADGAGDLKRPAGPRYTECWITERGMEELNHTALQDG